MSELFSARDALVTIGHGTVDELDDLPAFLTTIRRGHAAPPELIAEVRRRYQVIGGRSPLNDICRSLTQKLGEQLGVRAVYTGRMWGPKPEEALADLSSKGVTRVVVLPLAQHSAPLYVETVRAAAKALADKGGRPLDVKGPGNWGQEPKLTAAFAKNLSAAIDRVPPEARANTRVFFTAHSLPVAVLRGGDPYEREVRASAAAVASAVGGRMLPHEVIFQSQGMSGGEWLGPEVKPSLEKVSREGVKQVLFAPIGFLADHVEVLYDLDNEAATWAAELNLVYARTESLNAGAGLVDALEAVVRATVA